MWIETNKRFLVYRYLTGVIQTIPDESYCRKLLASKNTFDHLYKELRESDQLLATGFENLANYIKSKSNISPQELEIELGVERTRLFGGIREDYGPPPPYESIYLNENTLMGPATKEVMEVYRNSNVYTGWQHSSNLPDFLGTELEYLTILCQKCSRSNDYIEQQRLLELEKYFIENHIGKWVNLYITESKKWIETSFFESFMLILQRIIGL